MKEIKLIIVILFASINIGFSQTAVLKKGVEETAELIVKKSYKLLGEKTSVELIEAYSKVLIKNGLGKHVRVKSSSIEKVLEETYELRGKEALIKVGQKLSSYNGGNINSIKGFLAEELHHNYLLKIKGVKNIKSGYREATSKFVQKEQNKIVREKGTKNLYTHSKIELDLMGEHKGSKFLIEVKNIDSNFSPERFNKIKSQCAKQRAYADENGIKEVFWSNVGSSLLSPQQMKELEALGVKVMQHGSTSPLINAKLNMNRIKRALLS